MIGGRRQNVMRLDWGRLYRRRVESKTGSDDAQLAYQARVAIAVKHQIGRIESARLLHMTCRTKEICAPNWI